MYGAVDERCHRRAKFEFPLSRGFPSFVGSGLVRPNSKACVRRQRSSQPRPAVDAIRPLARQLQGSPFRLQLNFV